MAQVYWPQCFVSGHWRARKSIPSFQFHEEDAIYRCVASLHMLMVLGYWNCKYCNGYLCFASI